MKTLLFIHWNILHNDDGVYSISDSQDFHLKLLSHYKYNFSEVLVILHTTDLHDIVAIHDTEVKFDSLFKSNVSFIIEKTKTYSDNFTFGKHFLQLINTYPNSSYDNVFYINDIGYNDELTENLKYWIASLYYYNFERIHNAYKSIDDFGKIIFGGLVNYEKNINLYSNDTLWWFPGGFFGLNLKNYNRFAKEHSDDIPQYNEFSKYQKYFSKFIPIDKVSRAEKLNIYDGKLLNEQKFHDNSKLYESCRLVLQSKLQQGYLTDKLKIQNLLNL